ncbi:MAG: hypothetical protein KGV43_01815 [Arcobacter sp.]|nr:hypothetical protein [Arcobacter sp.]
MFLKDYATKKQFKLFVEKNNIEDIYKAIELFSVFGGYDIKLDCTKTSEELIEQHILNNYEELKYQVNKFTNSYHVNHAILTGIAQGDRKTTTSFKRAHVSFEEGMKCVDNLLDTQIIEIESPLNFLVKSQENTTSKKLLFTVPFLRFWFAFISPIYKGIKERNYKEFFTLWQNRKTEFQDFICEELALEYIQDIFKEEGIKLIGKYWNKDINIDILAKTKSGKIIAGNYINSSKKVKKDALNKLKSDCEDMDLKVDIYTLFSKNGYTSELKSLKSENIRLFTLKSFKYLI